MRKKNIYNIYQEEVADDASESDKVDPNDDEEIDEDMVFNESDEEKFGLYFPGKDDASDEDDDDDGQGRDLSDLLKRESLHDLINPKFDSEDDQFEEFSDSESEGSVKDLSMLMKNKRKTIDLTGNHGEFSIPSSGKLTLSDLMETVQEETSFGALKKKLKGLENTSRIDAPAATRIKNRMERKAAYEEANKKISKWTSIIKKNREADHLHFDEDKGANLTSAALVGQFNPMTDMEKEIQSLIKQSGMSENDVLQDEELKMVNISKEQLLERQKELSKMRALCFFKEQKQKKIAKIKSKVYRKLHRKKAAVDALDLDLEELKRLDPQLAKEKIEKMELERAKERVSLKHKNTSKWAKQILSRKDNDPETRIALMKQLEKHQELKKKITGLDSDDSDSNGELENGENPMIKLDELENELNESEPQTSKGLMGMKFMQRAMERQKAEAKEMIRNVRDVEKMDSEDMLSADEGSSVKNMSTVDHKEVSDDSDEYLSNDSGDYKEDDVVLGLQTSGPITIGSVKQLKPLFEVTPFQIKEEPESAYFGNVNRTVETKEESLSPDENDDSGRDDEDLKSEASIDDAASNPEINKIEEKSSVSNPWLQVDVNEPLQKSRKQGHMDDSVRSSMKLAKHKKKLEDEKDSSMIQMEAIEEDVDKVDDLVPALDKQSDGASSDDDNQSQCSEESNDDGIDVIHSTNIKSLSRSDIMRMTFENDNIIDEEFENEKKKIIERDMPKEEDLTLPGWGTWGGVGIKATKQKKVVKSIPGIETERRKDSKLKHVIINEKRLKKSIQYLVPHVPHGFENRDQYERTIRMPIGKEWNAQNIYLEKIAPKIEKKLGVAIQPLKFVAGGKKRRKL